MILKNSLKAGVLISTVFTLSACQNNMFKKQPLIIDKTLVPQKQVQVEVVKDVVNSIDLTTDLPVFVDVAKGETAFVSGYLLMFDENIAEDEVTKKLMESIQFKESNAKFDSKTSKVPFCNLKDLGISVPDRIKRKGKRVNTDAVKKAGSFCLSGIRFEIPAGFPLTVRRNGQLYYENKLSYTDLIQKLKDADTEGDKVRLMAAYLNYSNLKADGIDELLNLMDQLDEDSSKASLIKQTVPSSVQPNLDDRDAFLNKFEDSNMIGYNLALKHLLKYSPGQIDFYELAAILRPLNPYQQIDVLNVLPKNNLKDQQNFDSSLEMLLAFKSPYKRVGAFRKTVGYMDLPSFTSTNIEGLLGMFEEGSPMRRETKRILLEAGCTPSQCLFDSGVN